MGKHLAKHWKVYLYIFTSLALFTYVVYDYERLDDMSDRKAGVYGVLFFLAIVYLIMPFTKQIQIGFLKFVPWLFNKTEQLERDVSEAKATADGAMEKAIDAMKIAIEAYETAKKMRPMTEDEVTELFEGIFGKNKK